MRAYALIPLLVATAPWGAAAQSRFRSSLTATVMISPPADHGKTAGVPAGPGGEESASLGCRRVTLRWNEMPGARRYVVYVSARSAGPWSKLPASNVCGAVRTPSETSLVDVEPTTGAPAVSRRLYYKVFAVGAGADSPVLDVTEPVGVEFP